MKKKIQVSSLDWKDMLVVHFIKIDACTLGSAVQAFHKECESCWSGIGTAFCKHHMV